MHFEFAFPGFVAVAAALLAVSSREAVHGLLFFVLSLLGVALLLAELGAPLAAALLVIVYAGAIVVLILFVTMMMGPGAKSVPAGAERIAAALAVVLLVEFAWLLWHHRLGESHGQGVGPGTVARSLFGTYIPGVELASMVLLAALVGACHIGRARRKAEGES